MRLRDAQMQRIHDCLSYSMTGLSVREIATATGIHPTQVAALLPVLARNGLAEHEGFVQTGPMEREGRWVWALPDREVDVKVSDSYL